MLYWNANKRIRTTTSITSATVDGEIILVDKWSEISVWTYSEHVLYTLAPMFLMCLMFIENLNDTKWNRTHNAHIGQYPVTTENGDMKKENSEKYCVSNIVFRHCWTPSLRLGHMSAAESTYL